MKAEPTREQLLNIIASLKGDVRKKEGKILGLMKQLKMIPPKVRRRAIKGEIVSAGYGAISKLTDAANPLRLF